MNAMGSSPAVEPSKFAAITRRDVSHIPMNQCARLVQSAPPECHWPAFGIFKALAACKTLVDNYLDGYIMYTIFYRGISSPSLF